VLIFKIKFYKFFYEALDEHSWQKNKQVIAGEIVMAACGG